MIFNYKGNKNNIPNFPNKILFNFEKIYLSDFFNLNSYFMYDIIN